jgi:hypothetical protein
MSHLIGHWTFLNGEAGQGRVKYVFLGKSKTCYPVLPTFLNVLIPSKVSKILRDKLKVLQQEPCKIETLANIIL